MRLLKILLMGLVLFGAGVQAQELASLTVHPRFQLASPTELKTVRLKIRIMPHRNNLIICFGHIDLGADTYRRSCEDLIGQEVVLTKFQEYRVGIGEHEAFVELYRKNPIRSYAVVREIFTVVGGS